MFVCHAHQHVQTVGVLLLREDSKDDKQITNYVPTIILHVYFSNDVASLQKSDVTESESDDCQQQCGQDQSGGAAHFAYEEVVWGNQHYSLVHAGMQTWFKGVVYLVADKYVKVRLSLYNNV